MKRHRKATQGARVFGKGFAAGAKKAVKFAKDVKKVVSEEELKKNFDEDGEIVQELFGIGNKKYPYGKATKKNPRGKRDQAELDRAQAYLKKNPNFGKVSEAKVDQGRSDYGKASIRNYRRKGLSLIHI